MSGDACTALDDTGQPCPCLAYREGENLDPPIRCLECLHGRSQHRGGEVKPTIASILQGIVAKGAFSKKTVSMVEATKETNEGLKKSGLKSKGKTKSKPTSKADSGKAFSVMAIVVNTGGTEEVSDFESLEDLQLVDDRVPDKQKMQVMSQYGLVKLSTLDENAIELRSSWSFDEVDSALRSHLPDLFAYLDGLDTPSDDDGPIPQWMLCARKHNKLRLLPQIRPTGGDLYFNRGVAKSSWQNCTIYIATRSEIPLSEVKSWTVGHTSAKPSSSKSKGKEKAIELTPTSSAEPSDTSDLRSGLKRRPASPSNSDDLRDWSPPPLKKGFLTSFAPANTTATSVEAAALSTEASTSTAGPTTRARNRTKRFRPTPTPRTDVQVQEVISISPSPSPPPPPAPAPAPAPALPSTPPQPSRPVNPAFSGSSEVDTSFENPYTSGTTSFTF